MTIVLDANNLSVRAGEKRLLDGVSLTVAAGERVAIVGPNGAGKTTLLRALAGERALHDGTLLLKGKDIRSYSASALSLHRAVLSQHVTVSFPFTVAEVVAMGRGNRGGRWLDRLVEEKLAQVELTEFAGRPITTLSGGEQQRAHLARVLVQLTCGSAANGPGLLLLDEPTSNLDLGHQLELITIARESASLGVTVVAVLHDLNLAAMFADRVVVMRAGRVRYQGPPRETITEPVLRGVFGVAGGVGATPSEKVPFVLPHQMRRTEAVE